MSEGDSGERPQEREQADDNVSQLLRSLLPVARKGFVVGAGLHVGQVLISGVVSRKLLKE